MTKLSIQHNKIVRFSVQAAPPVLQKIYETQEKQANQLEPCNDTTDVICLDEVMNINMRFPKQVFLILL